VYNYALPRLSLAREAACFDDDTCGRYLVAGYPLPPVSDVAGSIALQGAVPAVASMPLSLQSSAYYLLVRVPPQNAIAPQEGCA